MMKTQTVRKLGRKAAAGALSLALLLGVIPGAELSAWAAGASVEGGSTQEAAQPQAESWAQEYLDKLVSWGVMRGDIEGNLHPELDISRAEFVTMVNRAYGYDEVGVNPFEDVDYRSWYADDISIAYNVGYFTGTSPTTAVPEGELTREQATLLLGRNMMLEPSTGETLGYSDSRDFSDWSRAMVESATNAGIISGYPDGSFGPQNNITRGEVAAMLARSLGNPIYEPGDYSLGNVYGNVTISTSGVNLRNTVIAGDLYLTGGIGLGDLLLENVNVLGRIIASGAGESNKGDSSIILRNVEADSMVVDSINNQFVTVRAEGDTDIGVTSVRTPAYLEDTTPDGFGLELIQLEGEAGSSLQLAGNIKEVINLTPGSSLIMAQGSAKRITVDEKAVGANLQIDLGGRVKELNLDVATNVGGRGDVDHVNISASGCTVAMPPDTVNIRPGVTANVGAESMDNVTAAEYSADPRLMAGYPEVRDAAPTSATAVFSTNKRGTVYWALSALADGSVSEEDLISPPVYGGTILASGNLLAGASKTEYVAGLTKLTTDGSYYLSAVMVDSRGQHSPVKVTAFTTPDDTVPAFTSGYPVMSRIQSESAQVTVMTNKDCLLYWAVLPAGSTAPKAQDFKAAGITGALGYGSMDTVKNSTMPFTVNNITTLDEMKSYDLYLWLTDYDGAKSSAVRKMTFTTVDGTPPVVRDITQSGAGARTVTVTYMLNEPGDLYWSVVKSGDPFLRPVTGGGGIPGMGDTAAKSQVESGFGAVRNGRSSASRADTNTSFTISGLEVMTSYDLYYVAKDKAGNYSETVGMITVNTQDGEPPKVHLEFSETGDPEDNTKDPVPTADARLVFNESIQGFNLYNGVKDDYEKFLEKYYQNLLTPDAWALFVKSHIRLWRVDPEGGPDVLATDRSSAEWKEGDPWEVDYRYVSVSTEDGNLVVNFSSQGNTPALNMESGATYYFRLENISDAAMKPNAMSNQNLQFTTLAAQVNLRRVSPSGDLPEDIDDFHMTFRATPRAATSVEKGIYWDLLVWCDKPVEFEIYRRAVGTTTWEKATNKGVISPAPLQPKVGYSVTRCFDASLNFGELKSFDTAMEYGIMITKLNEIDNSGEWNETVVFEVTAVSGETVPLKNLAGQVSETNFTTQKGNGVEDISSPKGFTVDHPFTDEDAPYFTGGYPEFEPKDTSVDISIRLNRSNNVYYYYIVAPLNDVPTVMKDGTDIRNVTAWETLLEDGKDLVAPDSAYSTSNDAAVATLPVVRDVMFPTYDNPDIITGNGKYNGGAVTLNNAQLRSELQADTEYIAYFVLTGESSETRSPVYCFRFKTEKLIKPILSLSIKNGDNSKVETEVTRTAIVQSRLLYSGNILAPFNDPFSNYLNDKADSAANKPWNGGTGTDASGNSYTVSKDSYTVLMAMEDSVYSGGPSVFDEYANENIRTTVANMIRSGATGGVDRWGPESVTMEKKQDMSFTLSNPDGRYICVAVAKVDQEGAEDAFRAVRYVEIVDKKGPEADQVTVDLIYNEADNKIEGTVTVHYDKQLYRVFQNNRYPLTEKKDEMLVDGPNDETYCGFKNVFSSKFYEMVDKEEITITQEFTLEFDRPFATKFEISLPSSLVNRNGFGAPAQKVVITYNKTAGEFSGEIE